MGFFLALKLRRASDTLSIEKKRDDLRRDYEEFESFSNSEELQHFYELEKYVLSDSFKKNKKNIEGYSYKRSDLYQSEKQFKRFQRSKKFKTYFRLKDSSDLSTFSMMENSEEIVRYSELEKLVKSPGFNKKQQAEELKEFKTLKQSARIKEYFKFKKSRAYRIYKEVDASVDLKKYIDLEERISTDEFQNEKAFLLDKKRFEKTDDFKKLQEYQSLKKSETYIKYFKLKEKNPFTDLQKWELTFSDEFEGAKLDQEKWITRFYWGDKLMDKGYSLENELQLYTDGQNISLNASNASLQARKEKMNGLMWKGNLGFVPQDFDYTSAIMNSGKTFRQKFGRFEAKIKLQNHQQVRNSFWMVADKSTPHIDIIKTLNGGSLFQANYWGNEEQPQSEEKKVKGVDLTKGYFIYTLEWTATELIWKINDVVVRRQNQGVPQDEMYLNFALAVLKDQNNLNSCMNIDWVRCYQRKE
jgi:beta-glucanase (GH16 family)